MIRLSQRSIITPIVPEPPNFPKYVYNLVPFSELPQHANLFNRFLDIIGYVATVSNVAKVRYGYGKLETKRIVILKDEKGNSIEISLWGPRATEFDGDTVYKNGQDTAVIAIFVGTLAKNVKTDRGNKLILTGSSACRWYINEDTPAVNEFYSKLLQIEDELEPVQAMQLQGDDENTQRIEKKTLLQLYEEVDPVEHKNQRFESTITIKELAPNQGWWYRACKSCHSKTFLHGSGYKCTNEDCVCTEAIPRYKLCVMGNDDTYELEFVLFDLKAEQLIGKPVEKLAIMYAKNDVPPEIAALIGQKYTFIVKVSSKRSFTKRDPSFQVLYITHQFGKQTDIPSSHKQEQSSSSTISLSAPRHVPPLRPIKYKINTKQDELPLVHKSQTDIDPMEIEPTGEQDSHKNKRDQPSDDDNSDNDYLSKGKKAKQ
ncbi:unnamed protein product [Urochloa decumbens]|uniref:Replication protein A OB domain-containing protein n=1 Tax=Urochloa decumbens TaxID=240449 RepID=A0ABC8YVM6_9POAL